MWQYFNRLRILDLCVIDIGDRVILISRLNPLALRQLVLVFCSAAKLLQDSLYSGLLLLISGGLRRRLILHILRLDQPVDLAHRSVI